MGECEISFKSPLENDDFFKLVISEERANGKKFQECIDYDLNVGGYDRNDSLFSLIRNNISLFSENVKDNYEQLKDGNIANIIDDVVSKWKLNEMSFDKSYKLYLKNRDYFDRYFDYYHGGWFYLVSQKTNPVLDEVIGKNDVIHRLYIAINSNQIDSFCMEFQSVLEKYNLPYEFKFQPNRVRSADSICIYSNSMDMTKRYIDILLEMVNKNDDYRKAIHQPQSHLGIINGMIGFGFEFGNGYSYSEIMESVTQKALDKACKEIFDDRTSDNNRIVDFNMKKAYEKGILNTYILSRARVELDMYNTLKDLFYINFRNIFEDLYPDYDLDMEDVRNNLSLKSMSL